MMRAMPERDDVPWGAEEHGGPAPAFLLFFLGKVIVAGKVEPAGYRAELHQEQEVDPEHR